MRCQPGIVCLATVISAALVHAAMAAEPYFKFRDTGEESGLLPLVRGAHGHGAGWGDADGDGWPELYVGTFHSEGPPNMLLKNKQGKFELDSQEGLRISTRATGILFADLDNDGDLDLYVGSMPALPDSKLAQRTGHPLAGCTLFKNEGNGRYTNVSENNGACPVSLGGRSVTVLDFDGDGLLDLLVAEDPIPGYNGSQTSSSRLFRNAGDLQFEDVSQQVGLPKDVPGLGVAAGDLNNDGWPDFFIASSGAGGNRLFLNDGRGKFKEPPGAHDLFHWPTARGDDMCCGVVFGDVNGDGLLDIVLGQHYQRPWLEPVRNRLYLNQGVENGVPKFADVTEKAGLIPLTMKAPHVEIQDFDNDGRPDIYSSVVKFADGQPHPVIFRNLGNKNGLPQFATAALDVNDFPTAEDKAVKRTGAFFDKMVADRKIIYTAPGPSCDYDRDGRLDLFLANWWVESPSMLLKNETVGEIGQGNWLDVRVEGTGKANRMGIGARVNVYEAGQGGKAAALIGCREIAAGYGYASGQEAVAHFGLGTRESVDIEVLLPHGRGKWKQSGVKANQRITIDK